MSTGCRSRLLFPQSLLGLVSQALIRRCLGSYYTNCFTQASKAQGNHIRPSLPFDALEELSDKEKTKNGGKECVGSEVRVVIVDGSLKRTSRANGSAILEVVIAIGGDIRRHDVVVLETRHQGCNRAKT